MLEETRNNQLLAQIKDHPPVPLLKKVVSCTAEQLGLHSLLGPPAGYVGRPIPGTKPFVMGNAAKGTSLAGKAARWLFGDLEFESAMPTLVGGPFARKALKVSFTKSVGTFAGRAVPVLGWALISYDVVSIAACTAR